MRGLIAFVVGCLVASWGGPSRAEVLDPDAEVARRHFERGAALYDGQKYEAAIVEFRAAQKLRPSPVFDFNIARCYDRLGRWSDAIVYYDRYARSNPRDRAQIVERLAVLRARVSEASPPPVERPPPVVQAERSAPPPRPIAKRWYFWTGLVLGAAVVGGAVALGVVLSEPSRPSATLGVAVLSF